jgi:hypothetical protein
VFVDNVDIGNQFTVIVPQMVAPFGDAEADRDEKGMLQNAENENDANVVQPTLDAEESQSGHNVLEALERLQALRVRRQLAAGELEDAIVPSAAAGDEAFDFGDLPAPYPTLLRDDGVRHRFGTSPLYRLGALADAEAEADGQVDPCGLNAGLSASVR